MSYKVVITAIAGIALLLAAACDDENGTSLPEGVPTGIDYDAILNDVDEVRTMLEDSASDLAPDVVTDVEYSDSTLTVTVGADAAGVDEAAGVCQDVADAIALGSLSVRVVDESGSEVATCES